MFEHWIARWQLVPDGTARSTRYSRLLPVRYHGIPAMLKVSSFDEERRGAELLAWWRGDGAVRVLEREGDALVTERATGRQSLEWMARSGRDDEASAILVAAAERLHAPRARPLPAGLVSLDRWFRSLPAAAAAHGGVLAEAAAIAGALLAAPREPRVLHGDLHHGNVLDGGERGWLAIDPKGLVGERTFDFANIFFNPAPAIALADGRLDRRLSVVAAAARLDAQRLLRWIAAYAGLSAAWSLEDGDDPATALEVARLAIARL